MVEPGCLGGEAVYYKYVLHLLGPTLSLQRRIVMEDDGSSHVGSLQRMYAEASLGWLSPAALTAVTLNWYSLPSSRPVIFRRVS